MAKRPRRPVWPSFTAGRHLRPSRYRIWISFPVAGTRARKEADLAAERDRPAAPETARLEPQARPAAHEQARDPGRRLERAVAGEAHAHLARGAARQPDRVAAAPVGDDFGQRLPGAACEPPRLDQDARVGHERAARTQDAAEPRALAIAD